MKIFLCFLGFALIVPLGGAAPMVPPDPPVVPGDPGWQALFQQLTPKGDRMADFVEKRFFPFRGVPVVLTGVVRISPAHGLSLQYLTPAKRIVIVDARGVVMRDSRGRDSAAPARAQEASAAMLAVLRFDWAALAARYDVHGSRSGEEWRLSLLPRPGASADEGYAAVVLGGQGGELRSIEFIRSAHERVAIALANDREDFVFPPDVLARYFRG